MAQALLCSKISKHPNLIDLAKLCGSQASVKLYPQFCLRGHEVTSILVQWVSCSKWMSPGAGTCKYFVMLYACAKCVNGLFFANVLDQHFWLMIQVSCERIKVTHTSFQIWFYCDYAEVLNPIGFRTSTQLLLFADDQFFNVSILLKYHPVVALGVPDLLQWTSDLLAGLGNIFKW